MGWVNGIECEFMNYPKPLLEAWEEGDYSFLVESRASNYIKEILVCKAKKRPGRRFFGEAYISSKIEMKDGWYSSFKWLTSPNCWEDCTKMPSCGYRIADPARTPGDDAPKLKSPLGSPSVPHP